MIPSSHLVKLLATTVAVALTGAVIAVGLRPEPVEIAGGAAAVEASLGTSFADLSVGTLSGDTEAERHSPETARETATVTPQGQTILRPTAPEAVRTPAIQDAPVPEVGPAEAAPLQPTSPTTIARAASVAAMRFAVPETDRTAAPEPISAEPAPTETVTGEPPKAVAVSRRPTMRPDEIEARAQPAPSPPTPRGNADQAARAGSETGRKPALVAASTGRGNAQAVGNAAASNYPGKVMSRLSRVPKPTIRARGTATVSFSVVSSGGLAGVRIARSSGSAGLDRAAVRMVQRAAPFPAPPPGAQRSFSVRIAGR